MPVFGNLNTLPIRTWDEGRIAINACEMRATGDLLVTTFNFKPDMWNTKPPLLVWCMVFFMKLIGVNELSVRLPSAFAAFFSCLALLLFLRRYFKDAWMGIIAVLILITANGYINYHVSRTGDYDALLTFFTTVSCLYFYTFTETNNKKFLYLFFITLTCGVLTKGVAGLLFTPALFLYCVIQKKLKLFFLNKHFYFGIGILFLLGFGFYFLRELHNPGYLEAIQENELGGRYLKSQGNQEFDFWFYYTNLTDRQFSAWILFVPCGFLAGWFSKDPRMKRFILFLTLLIFSFFIIISAGKTRLEQYVAPLFPLLAIISALFIYYVFVILRKTEFSTQQLSISLLPLSFLLFVFADPYAKIWNKTYHVREDYTWEEQFYEISYFFKSAVDGHYDLNGKYFLYDGYNAHTLFYIYALQDKGVKISQRFAPDIHAGETFIVSQVSMRKMLEENYTVTFQKVTGEIYYYKILGDKNS